MSAFDELLSELETLQKAMPADADDVEGVEDDEKIKAAAEEDDGDEGQEGGEDAADDGDDESILGKSFKVTLEDGSEVEAFDGMEMIKSMQADIHGNNEAMTKALGVAVDMLKSMTDRLTQQGDLIKSLQSDLAVIGGQGRGRKTTVSVLEKPAPEGLKKSEGISPKEFMVKALAAQKAGKLSGHEVAVAESCLGRGQSVPEHIVTRVIGGN